MSAQSIEVLVIGAGIAGRPEDIGVAAIHGPTPTFCARPGSQ
jgi:hypothetical protein